MTTETVWQEVSDTDLLLDLCDGIYLARVQGNLHAEWMLYHAACSGCGCGVYTWPSKSARPEIFILGMGWNGHGMPEHMCKSIMSGRKPSILT